MKEEEEIKSPFEKIVGISFSRLNLKRCKTTSYLHIPDLKNLKRDTRRKSQNSYKFPIKRTKN